jgi:hypothetical protein
VRLARGASGRRVTSARRTRSRAARLVLGAAVCGVCSAACDRGVASADDVSVEWKMTPRLPIVGTAAIGEMTLRDHARRPVRGARLQIEGHMSHPGMAPVIAAAAERGDGVYEVRLQFTMSGDWILLVTGSLPDGRRLNHRIDTTHARPAG